MRSLSFKGKERRRFERLEHVRPLAFKVCKRKTVSRILRGYTSNISQSGLLCNIRDRVRKDDILWLSFDRATLEFCGGLEKKALIYQNGIIAKVIRSVKKPDGSSDVGLHFITREEKNLSHIYPRVKFTVRPKNV
ncbi:MAG: PilZ domain-containing protein [Candidatus Omnitrophica bacterium]|nr:PilZ domain-containing protein [Candidatus Omnitrophota bacterium]